MNLQSTLITDVKVLKRDVRQDERGSFTRLFGKDELALLGHEASAIHVNSSTSTQAGTLRGIHFQYPPHAEEKIVSCVRGAVWDLAVDLRPNSPTRFQWHGELLTPENGTSLIVPEGCGHAFITLEDDSTVVYAISTAYAPGFESGIAFDDPLLSIEWPMSPTTLSSKDQSWSPLQDRINELTERFSSL